MDTQEPDEANSEQKTVVIPRRPKNQPPGRRARSLVAAAIATVAWNLAVVIAPLLLTVIGAWWITGRQADVDTVIATVGTIWVAGHAVPVTIGAIPVSMTPLLLTLVLVWRLSRAGAHTMRAIGGRDSPAVRAVTLAVSLLYLAVFSGVVAYASQEPYDINIVTALLIAGPVTVISVAWGAATESGGIRRRWNRASLWLRRGLRTGALASAALVACGAILAGVSVAINGGAVGESLRGYDNGEWAVGLLCLLFLPNIAIWAATYIIGPGFAVGQDTVVQITEVTLNPLPPLPWFAALPSEPLHTYGSAILGVPLMIGVVLGIVLTYRSPDLRLPRVITAALVAALTVGLVFAGLSWASSGSAGSALLSDFGPRPWQVAGILAAQMAIAFLASALVARMFAVHRRATEAEVVRRDTVVIPSPADSPESQ